MWNKLHLDLWILLFFLADSSDAVPMEMPPRFKHLGHRPNASKNLTIEVTSTTTTPSPPVSPQPEPANFEYALLGQDPKDQHWYRVSLTPKRGSNKPGSGGYRAEFATRELPLHNEQLAQKHDKTIVELLNWLEQSEERNLLRVYRDLLVDEANEQTITNTNEIGTGKQSKHGKGRNQPLLLADQNEGKDETKERTTPKNLNSTETDDKMIKNFVYFIKALE